MRHLLLWAFSLVFISAPFAQKVTWESLDGPYGGKAHVVGTEDGTAFLGIGSRIERSDDGGLTWVETGFPGSELRALDRGHDGALLAAAGSGAYRLYDNEWTSIGIAGEPARRAATDATGVTYVWQSQCTIARSEDLQTWEVTTHWTDWPCIDMLVTPEGELLVIRSMDEIALDYWVEHSTDGGATWTSTSPGQHVRRLVSGQHGGTFAIAPPSHDGYSGPRPPRTYRWTGSEWDVISTDHVTAVTTTSTGVVVFGYADGFPDGPLEGHLARPFYLVETAAGAWLAGTAALGLWRWTETEVWHQLDGAAPEVTVLARDRDDQIMADVSLSTVHHDGDNWRHGLWTGGVVRGIVALPERTLLASSGDDDLFQTHDANAGIWDLEAGQQVEVSPDCNDFGPCLGNALLKSGEVVLASLGGPATVCSPGDERCTGGGITGLFLSTDGGHQWSNVLGVSNLCHLDVSPNGTLWAGPGDPNGGPGRCLTFGHPGQHVHFSINGGESWTPVAEPVPGSFVTALAAGAHHTFVATGPQAVYRLVDGGWQSIGGPGSVIYSLALSVNQVLLAGTETGFFTYDGVNWRLLDFGGLPVTALRVEDDGIVYVGTSQGIFRSQEPLVVGAEDDPVPAGTLLQAIYPNPARGDVTVAIYLNDPGPATLTLYDLLGRVVDVPVEAVFAAGGHEVAIKLGQLAAGLYLVELRAGDVTVVRRLTVLGP